MLKYLQILLFTLVFAFGAKAQQPAHYFIGQEELAGVDIYSIAQAPNGCVYLSSNQGLIKYNGYKFKFIKHAQSKSHSLFGLRQDNFGNLFCCNLNGQIYQVKNDSLQLFYEVPDSLLAYLLHFNFDNKNRLVFCAKDYYWVNENGELNFILSSSYTSNPIAKNGKQELVLLDLQKKSMFYFKNGVITDSVSLPFRVNAAYIKNQRSYFWPMLKSNVYKSESAKWNPITFDNQTELNKDIVNFFPLTDSVISFANKNNGINFFNPNGEALYNSFNLFSKHRLSCAMEDKEGNVWLPTLGKGIIVIPSFAIVDFGNHKQLKEDDINAITVTENGKIFAGGMNAKAYQFNGQKVNAAFKVDHKIELFESVGNNHFIVNSSLVNGITQKQTPMGVSSLKDVWKMDANNFLLASNKGLFSMQIEALKPQLKVSNKPINKTRSNCVAFDSISNKIWVGTINGLKVIDGNSEQAITINDKPISANDIAVVNHQVWVSTTNNGVLIFKDQNQFQEMDFTRINNLRSVYQLKAIGNKVYFTTENGLYVYHTLSNKTIRYSKTEGLLSNRITDFEVVGNTIWLVFPGGVQSLNMAKLNRSQVKPRLHWQGIRVMDNDVSSTSVGEFKHTQNQVEFSFISYSYRHQGNLTYSYQLQGLNEAWQNLNFKNNSVKYSSLPPGNYSFKVKAINENGLSSDQLIYQFSILQPVWQQWWFFVAIGLLLVGLVSGIFIIRLNIIRKRLILEKQLKISEITAIKAQMNPHFIFNALNSIQDLIMLKDIRSSNGYLGMFADLMRKTLEYSNQNFNRIANEIELLELYLELEKLRFGNDFKTSIKTEMNQSQLNELRIPAMLLQPYVENAIKHGLLHKQGIKELSITFKLQGNTVICEILDNGVGREKSRQIQARREKAHLSFSTEANTKRIDLIRESTNTNISVNTIDLKENGKALGTKVVFTFDTRVG